MCGRYVIKTSTPELARMFGVDAPHDLPETIARYNVAPTQPVLACRVGVQGRREIASLRWGLIPSWARDKRAAARMINARAETVAERPAFRAALRRRRCLIPASGFYEWQRLEGRKQPFLIGAASGHPFAFAGLWEVWRPPEAADPVHSCTIITTTANPLLEAIHDRMPVILPSEHFDAWLDHGNGPAQVLPLLAPYDAGAMTAVPVSTHVNRPQNDDPRCVEPLTGAEGGGATTDNGRNGAPTPGPGAS